MNRGASAATGDLLLFLHADTRISPEAIAQLLCTLDRSHLLWGRFDVRIEGRSILLRLIASLMNWRSRITGIATGDQAIFVRREAFFAIGGYQEISLMEDIRLSARLRRLSRPVCLNTPVVTSGRRWETQGVVRTVVLMWVLRIGHFLGVHPDRLARAYGYGNCAKETE